ncbi:MAG: MFS transporter [bacterium]
MAKAVAGYWLIMMQTEKSCEPKQKAPLPPLVWATSVVSFFTDFSSELIYPLLPIFLTTTLGLSRQFVGLIEGIAETTASFLKIVSGRLSDRAGMRTPFVIGGYSLSAVARPLLCVASSGPQALFLRFLDRFGKGVRSVPRDALINDCVPPEIRGRAYGVQRAMDHGGAIAGSLGGFVLLHYLGVPTRTVILLSAIPGALAVATVFMFVRDVKSCPPATEKKKDISVRAALPPRMRVYLFVLVFFALGNSSDAFLLLRAKQMGVATAFVPLLWAALHVTKVIFSVYGGNLSDRVGRRRVIVGGWLVYAGVYAGFAFAVGATAAWLLFIVYGIYFGFTEGVEKAFVADIVPREVSGTAFGAFNLVVGLCALPSSLLMGRVWDSFGHRYAFLLGASLACVAAVLLLALVRESQRVKV